MKVIEDYEDGEQRHDNWRKRYSSEWKVSVYLDSTKDSSGKKDSFSLLFKRPETIERRVSWSISFIRCQTLAEEEKDMISPKKLQHVYKTMFLVDKADNIIRNVSPETQISSTYV